MFQFISTWKQSGEFLNALTGNLSGIGILTVHIDCCLNGNWPKQQNINLNKTPSTESQLEILSHQIIVSNTSSVELTTKSKWIMFKNTFQSGFLSILYSIGSKPLQIWDKKVRNGHIKRITDNDIQSLVLEIVGTNVSTTYITCPADPKKTLGIKLPFLVMIIKNLKKYFTFEVQVSWI